LMQRWPGRPPLIGPSRYGVSHLPPAAETSNTGKPGPVREGLAVVYGPSRAFVPCIALASLSRHGDKNRGFTRRREG
jgi:hypothetical protein